MRFLLLLFCFSFLKAQSSENLIIVTLDGLRWQEVFNGLDSALVHSNKFTPASRAEILAKYGGTAAESRQKLMPFLWGEVAQKGRIYGNRAFNNKVELANKYRYSYPGYNEIFTGFPDDSIQTNRKIWNPNVNVLADLGREEPFYGKVAAFTSWNVFTYIFNEPRSGFLVNAGVEPLTECVSLEALIVNDMQERQPNIIENVRLDHLTYQLALSYLSNCRPKIFYLGLDETDDFAHEGRYDWYIDAMPRSDKMIADLWQLLQSDPQYKDKTTLVITTDHGRGFGDEWTSHNKNIEGAQNTWFAVISPQVTPQGEMKTQGTWYSAQFAQTFAQFLGKKFTPTHNTYPAITFD